jgi:hypothetical protein
MGVGDHVAAGERAGVLCTKILVRDGAATGAICAASLAAGGARSDGCRGGIASGADNQTLQTIGLLLGQVIKAGANPLAAFGAGNQTIGAEALATGLAGGNVCAILLTTGATHGALGAN